MSRPHPRPARRLDAVVVVPARDEEALIGECMEALAGQRDLSLRRWEVILVLDDCRDGTERRALDAWQGPVPLLIEQVAFGGAGKARAWGMDLACRRLAGAGSEHGLIATTDADTQVARGWLAAQLAAVAEGAQVIGGRILTRSTSPANAFALARREEDLVQRHRDALAEGPADHPFFGGASIGITAAAYRAVGGMEPVAALEDEDLARRVRSQGFQIHRPGSVEVQTSSRTRGRASRGLARDLALHEWSHTNTWDGSSFDVRELVAAKRERVTVILPAKEVAQTVGGIVEQAGRLRSAGLVDQILVVDAASEDGTAKVAAAAGATVRQESELLADFGPCAGKGDAMWRAASQAGGELLVFCDADTTDFDGAFVSGLLGPLLTEPGVDLVKGAFERPFQAGPQQLLAAEGGRVTELVARPLLNLHFSELAGLEQPLAGEIAIRRELFEQLSVPAGYGVEIAMLIDVLRLRGAVAIGQSRLGTRQNRHQPLRALGTMAYEVMVAAQRRISDAEVVAGPLVHPAAGTRTRPVTVERPPLGELRGVGRRLAGKPVL